MAELVLLDSGPLGLACGRPGSPAPDRCRQWIDDLQARGVVVIVPEIADYEVRTELTRIGADSSIRRLDQLIVPGRLSDASIITADWRQAAVLWADARARGLPTASRDALDGDVLLAACATAIGQPGDVVIVATMNVGHLGRYCDARMWTSIVRS
jgi:hypothetical protein